MRGGEIERALALIGFAVLASCALAFVCIVLDELDYAESILRAERNPAPVAPIAGLDDNGQ